MSPRLRSLLTQAGGFLLAGLLLWLALRGLHFGALREALAAADYRWLPVLAALLLMSHWLRAWRWTMLLGGLPAQEAARPVRTPFAFAAVMIGYMVNYGAPRLGEVARTTLVSRESRRSFSGVLGTVVLERLLDVVVLACGLLTVPLLLGSRLQALGALFVLPAELRAGSVLLWAAVGVLTLGVGFLVLRGVQRRAAPRAVPSWWSRRVAPALAGFRDGLATLRTSRNRAGLIGTTLGIWAIYGLVAWLPFVMLGTDALYGISVLDGWCIMLLGSIGMVVPTPGGAGSYHYVTIQTLALLFGMAGVDAQVYAVFTHGAQLVLYTLTGALCLVAVVLRNRSRGPVAVQPLV